MTADRETSVRMGRLVLAGLAAGLILNIGEAGLHAGILGNATTAAYAALNRTVVPDAMNLVLLVALTLAQGVLMAWLYAVLRVRYGSRFTAAASVGLIAWVLSSVYAAVYLYAGLPGIFPANIVWVPVAWQLLEYPLAALAAAATYGD